MPKTKINISKNSGRFKAFIPLTKERRGGAEFTKVFKDDDGNLFVEGEASNIVRDRTGERISKNFLKKMQDTVPGKPVFVEHDTTLKNTLGYVSEVRGDENTFIAKTALEPPKSKDNEDGNENVTMILNKSKHGTPLSYSVGGKITKAYKEKDSDTGETTIVLDDGEITHLGITAVPAAYVSPLTVMAKSLGSEEVVTSETLAKEISHEELRDKLRKLAGDLFPLRDGDLHTELFIEKVYDDYFIVNNWTEAKYYKISYKMVDDEPELTGDKIEVVLDYVEKSNSSDKRILLFNKVFENYISDIQKIFNNVGVKYKKERRTKGEVLKFFVNEINSVFENIVKEINKTISLEGDNRMSLKEKLSQSFQKALEDTDTIEENVEEKNNDTKNGEEKRKDSSDSVTDNVTVESIKSLGGIISEQLAEFGKNLKAEIFSKLEKSGIEIDKSDRKISDMTVGELDDVVNEIITKSLKGISNGKLVTGKRKSFNKNDSDDQDDDSGNENENIEDILKAENGVSIFDIEKTIESMGEEAYNKLPEEDRKAIRSLLFGKMLNPNFGKKAAGINIGN
ncbi:MAG: hypothetical protein GF317_04810 [Candidatus Lokiarchaeota archaeon]|nr:hypothetical protein [Candidatus Lokiarchaeota archaeon]